MGLLAENRQQQILELLRTTGRVDVNNIARDLNVTEVTIRRDLKLLQNNGLSLLALLWL